MNEQILELAKIKAWHAGGGLVSDKAVEVIVELIVRKCAGIYEAIDHGNEIEGTDCYPDAIHKYFGVEK